MSCFKKLIEDALDVIEDVAGVEIKYARGASFVYIKAVPGKSNLSVVNSDGGATWFRVRDYIVSVDDLVINEERITPQQGDKITEREGNKLIEHQVGRPDGGDQHWQYSDSYRTHIRIHTKQKGTSNA